MSGNLLFGKKMTEETNRRTLERIVPSYIKSYFEDKNIPPDVDITSSEYVSLCIDTNMCDGADIAYGVLSKSGKFDTFSGDHSISEDIRFVIKTLAHMKSRVPQEFSAGMLLMHLELVEGLSFSTEI